MTDIRNTSSAGESAGGVYEQEDADLMPRVANQLPVLAASQIAGDKGSHHVDQARSPVTRAENESFDPGCLGMADTMADIGAAIAETAAGEQEERVNVDPLSRISAGASPWR